ncbi:hypothetical protein FE392_12995 [Xenorhabdus sp. 12]|uniref:Uncharacterized protein n=1 Tax=Xenorhabdus santafensis TaxID=2582833 RepID=A0ABU4SBR6_9GAMM|nr:hypothetical protein [Xenorhabdus sp. 12]MDX7988237.1 hypothetical protein [Xenorhabdus sp. 12]
MKGMLRCLAVRITQCRLSPPRDTERALSTRPRRAIMGHTFNRQAHHEPHRHTDQHGLRENPGV